VSTNSSIRTRGSALKWIDLLNESVHTSDDQDIGDIEAVNREFLVVKRGFINVHRYYIPTHKIDGWDGNVLWLKMTEEEIKSKYQKDDAVPDPARYLTKNYENFYRYAVYPPVGWTPARYVASSYLVPPAANSAEQPLVYKCDLCGTTFRDDQELNKHVSTTH
jgi:hypothetical protein